MTGLGGKSSLLQNIKADTLLVIDEGTANVNDSGKNNTTGKTLFKDVTQTAGISFIHTQSQSVDFKISPLLPYQLSRIGPCLAKSDVNRDGLEDLFIGASAGSGKRFIPQTKVKIYSFNK